MASEAQIRDSRPVSSAGQQARAVDGSSIDRFMPRAEVITATGLSDTTLWREYRAGRFPKPHPLTRNRVGWLESEVRAWMADRLHQAR